jgi:adenine/guanine phosphoribosyltransferase-like PRPP-binding protein
VATILERFCDERIDHVVGIAVRTFIAAYRPVA